MKTVDFDNSFSELIAAATDKTIKDRLVAETMFQVLKNLILFDSACINFCEVEKGYRLPQLKSYFYRQPDEMAENDLKTSHTDNFSPNLLAYTGNVIDDLSCLDSDEYLESPFYLQHCRYFGVENALAVAGRLPGHLHRYLVLYLFKSTPTKLFSKLDAKHLDRLFPVIFSCWQYRLGLICEETLLNRSLLLQELTNKPRLLKLIRLIVKNPLGTNKEYAREMGCSERTVEHQLRKLSDQLKINGYNKNKKIEIFRRFQFLES